MRVAFCDFSRALLADVQLLRDAVVSAGGEVSETPEYAGVLVFGDYGTSHRSFVGTKVHYTAENYRPPWRDTDFAIGFDHLDDDRYLRLPLPVLYAYRD